MEEFVTSITPDVGGSAATDKIDALTEEAQIRHRAIGIAFYACMTVVTLQLGITALEILWGKSQGGRVPPQISLFAALAAVPWACNFFALASRASRQRLTLVRTETVFAVSLLATFAGTYNLGFNVQIASFGIYCGVISTLRAGQLTGNLRVVCLFIAALAALMTRPGGLVDAELTSATAVNDSLAWNLFAAFLQPYALGIVINYSIDLLMESYRKSRAQLMRANKELSERWKHDALTGLLSRATLEAEFQAIHQTGNSESSELAVALIDLDNFKSINTFCGHGAGDNALLAFAERLRQLLPKSVLFRLGGDEFLVLQPVAGEEDEFIAKLKACAGRMKIDYHRDELHISASAGLTILAQPCDPQKALFEADIAMRQAKRKGKGTLVRFKPGASVPKPASVNRPAFTVSPSTSAASKSEIPAREVGAAILSNHIRYAVQPVFNAKTGAITAAECLLRWKLDDGSMVPIDHFLSTFIALEWQAPYMDHLLNQRQALFSAIRAVEEINVHFNYDAEALKSAAFQARVISALVDKPVNLKGWVVEIGEQGNETCGPVITEQQHRVLRNAGVMIAIDDFGVGQSNLERLAHVDADIVKLDKQFVTEGTRTERGLKILRHARELTHSLNMTLIAEGVETREQEAMLTAAGITEHQGFFRGRPKWPDQFIQQLRRMSQSQQLTV